MDNGRLKLYVTWRPLQLRARLETLFREGDYLPLRERGPRANNVCGFSRQCLDARLVVVTPRWFARLMTAGRAPVGDAAWEDTAIDAPRGVAWTNVLTGENIGPASQDDGTLRLAEMFSTLPWAVLIPAA